MTVAVPSSTVAPRVPWAEHHARMVDEWSMEDTPHVSLISPTRNGKTTLVIKGIVPALMDEQVLVCDVKGWDRTLNESGMRRIKKFPSRAERALRDRDPGDRHYVFMATDAVDTQRVLNQCYTEGNWTIILDEERAITDRHPSLGLSSTIEKMALRGGGRVCLVRCTQAPRWVSASFYEQASHMYIGRMEDKRARRRLQQIGGDSDMIDAIVSRLARYEFLYIGPLQNNGARTMEVTKFQ